MGGINAQLDHVVLLLPYDHLANPPAWLTDNFTISPGGVHGDNKTENRLVLFRDGTYLELIAFINDDPEKRRGHWWDQPFGVVDFAYTTPTPLDHKSLVDRLEKSETKISFSEPKEGGRLTPDGKQLKWRVTFPTGVQRGHVNFWCEDVTPRERRVPVTDANTTHPCGALGMAGMIQEVKKEGLNQLSTATSAILDVSRPPDNRYEVGVPNEVSKLKQPSVRLQAASQESDKPLALTLVLQSGSDTPRDAIRQKIGDGLIAIDFE